MKKGFVISVVIGLTLTLCCLQASCKTSEEETAQTMVNPEIYAVYSAYAASNSENTLSYEAWLASIKGEKGDKGDTGEKGEKGDTGSEGKSISSTNIDSNGNLIINYTDGSSTNVGKIHGSDGKTPHIGTNGNWYIGETDTGIRAIGKDGQARTSESENDTLPDVVDDIHASVVEINAVTSQGTSAGSGVVVAIGDEYSYIWTCQHVVSGATSITIILSNQEEYEGIYCGGVDDNDVAVLKVKHTENMVAACIRDLETTPLRVGEETIAIGNPLGSLGGTVTRGIVSATARDLNMDGTIMTLLQTDASINSGNSGGGLFDADGYLVGIVNAKATGSSVEGLGFAIPINFVEELATQLTTTHTNPDNPYGGLGYIPGKKILGVSGGLTTYKSQIAYYVTSVNAYGSAANALVAGDYILSVNGTTFTASTNLGDMIDAMNIGDTVQMVVVRSYIQTFYIVTKQITVTFTLSQYVEGYVLE